MSSWYIHLEFVSIVSQKHYQLLVEIFKVISMIGKSSEKHLWSRPQPKRSKAKVVSIIYWICQHNFYQWKWNCVSPEELMWSLLSLFSETSTINILCLVWTKPSQCEIVSWECKGSISHFQTFYMLLIYIFHFSTDKHLRLIKVQNYFSILKLTFILRIPQNKVAIWNFGWFYRHIIEKSMTQMTCKML